MASTLPIMSGAEVAPTFERLGWTVARQKGSHIILVKDGERATYRCLTTERWLRERYAV